MAATLCKKSLRALNTEAVQHAKEGDHEAALACYDALLDRVQKEHVTHAELYVCYCNRAASWQALGRHSEALQDANRCLELLERIPVASIEQRASYVKALHRKGQALMGLQCFRQAAEAFDRGLQLDPFHEGHKKGLQAAESAVIGSLLAGHDLQRRALPAADPVQRVTSLPHTAPLHRVRAEDCLPHRLLAPAQAERDHSLRDTYNYVTIQTDIRMPKKLLAYLQDEPRLQLTCAALEQAVKDIMSQGKDCRVLLLGSAGGLLAMAALQAGALHVVCVERWLYFAQTTNEVLLHNKVPKESFKVVYKRPGDCCLLTDVPICCNLMLAVDMLDDGLLTSGIIPAMRHANNSLLTQDAICIPAAATVYVQGMEMTTKPCCGWDVSSLDRYRAWPSACLSAPLAPGACRPLTPAVEAWHFDLKCPPDTTQSKTIDLLIDADGKFSTVMFWFDCHLYSDLQFSTGLSQSNCSTSNESSSVTSQHRSLQPALQSLAGQLQVHKGQVLPLRAQHNTVRLSFDIEEAEYRFLIKLDVSLPRKHFAMLVDEGRVEAYKQVLEQAVAARRQKGEEVVCLDLGTGTGVLAMAAAAAGARAVVAAEVHPTLCAAARQNVAAAGMSHRVSVVQADVTRLQKGCELPVTGCNMAVMDLFDAGLLGGNVLQLVEFAKRQLLREDADIMPAKATLYCMGVEVLTRKVLGKYDMAPVNKYRWQEGYETVLLDRLPHKQLTQPVKVFEFNLAQQAGRQYPSNALLKLEGIGSGVLNAVAFWFGLHLDDEVTISSAPITLLQQESHSSSSSPGLLDSQQHDQADEATQGLSASSSHSTPAHCSATECSTSTSCLTQHKLGHYWGQALQYLDCATVVQPGHAVMLVAHREGPKISFALRPGVGKPVPRAPWKVNWGGGVSIENPHVQRVEYCRLLVNDFLQRLPSGRFPSVEEDLKLMQAHCGSLYLDPASLAEVQHQLMLLEKLFKQPDAVPAVTPEAVSQPQLLWY